MSAKEKIAIIAGSGRLPEILAEKTSAKVITFEGQDLPNLKPDLNVNIGQIGAVLQFLKEQEIKQIVFAGGIVKPKVSDLKTDAVGAKLLAKIAIGSLFGSTLPGDNAILSKIIKYLEGEGFEVIGAHQLAPELLADKGAISGDYLDYKEDIELGIDAATELGKNDIGQAVVVANGKVLAEEGEGGTKSLIERCGEGVLVKCKKPQQDERVDLPSIGPDTIEQLKASGLKGVAVEANASLILDKELVIEKATKYGIFVAGV